MAHFVNWNIVAIGDRDGDLCYRGGRIRATDRLPGPAVQPRDLRQNRCASTSQDAVT